MKEHEFVCCLCGKKVKEWGNNPAPLAENGRCCDKCNFTKVVPARLGLLSENK